MPKLIVVVALAVLAAGSDRAAAQTYPSRPITIIAPFPAGGPSDALARILAEPIRSALGQAVVIENVAGAGGNIGVGRLARAAPDGYTIGIGQWSTHVVNAITYSLPYDVLHDFEPVALLAITPQLLIARKNFPADSVKELVDWLKANPDKATAATVGAAGGAQVTAMYFQQATGTRFGFVPYRGGAPAMQDLGFRPGGHHVRPGRECRRAGSQRRDQGLCRAHQGPVGRIAQRSIDRRSRCAVAPRVLLARLVGAEGHAQGRHRQAQCRGGQCAGRSDGTAAACRYRAGDLAARAADAGSAGGAPQGRNREVVADHQGGEHQGAREQQTRRVRCLSQAETEKWWPIIKAANIKAE